MHRIRRLKAILPQLSACLVPWASSRTGVSAVVDRSSAPPCRFPRPRPLLPTRHGRYGCPRINMKSATGRDRAHERVLASLANRRAVPIGTFTYIAPAFAAMPRPGLGVDRSGVNCAADAAQTEGCRSSGFVARSGRGVLGPAGVVRTSGIHLLCAVLGMSPQMPALLRASLPPVRARGARRGRQ